MNEPLQGELLPHNLLMDVETSMGEYIKRGERCMLWGVGTTTMTRDQLICCIGVLDTEIAKLKKKKK